jgi:hypothetical protein
MSPPASQHTPPPPSAIALDDLASDQELQDLLNLAALEYQQDQQHDWEQQSQMQQKEQELQQQQQLVRERQQQEQGQREQQEQGDLPFRFQCQRDRMAGTREDKVIIRPDSKDVGGSAVRGEIRRIISVRYDIDAVVMSQDYSGDVLQNHDSFAAVEMFYAGEPCKIARDVSRQIYYRAEHPAHVNDGTFYVLHVDLDDVMTHQFGRHKLWCYVPNDAVDRYGPLFSINGIMRALGMRAGGTLTACVGAVLSAPHCPSEVRNRVVRLQPPALSLNSGRGETFCDVHTLKCFLVCFGHKQATVDKDNELKSVYASLASNAVSSAVTNRVINSAFCEF